MSELGIPPEDDELGDDYRLVVTGNVRSSSIDVDCGGLAPQLVRVFLELAADYLSDICDWSITASNLGVTLTPAVLELEEDEGD